MPRWGTRLILLAVVVTTIGCDQVSKHAASIHLADGPRQSYLGDSLRLEYSENTGAFLSVGAGLPWWARTMLVSVGTSCS
jgi:signal peptidase II